MIQRNVYDAEKFRFFFKLHSQNPKAILAFGADKSVKFIRKIKLGQNFVCETKSL